MLLVSGDCGGCRKNKLDFYSSILLIVIIDPHPPPHAPLLKIFSIMSLLAGTHQPAGVAIDTITIWFQVSR